MNRTFIDSDIDIVIYFDDDTITKVVPYDIDLLFNVNKWNVNISATVSANAKM